MPNRIGLDSGTTIFKTALQQIQVGSEKGRGGSAIVYEGHKISNGKSEFCLVKEIYPNNKDVFRNENGTIQADSETGAALYQRIIEACEAEVLNYAELVGCDAPRNDIMLRPSEFISKNKSENGNAYLILDTVECTTLAEIEKISVYEACEYTEKLLAAVGYIHQKGALHLDIAPDNIIVAKTTGVVRLIDFNSSCFKDEKTGLYHSGSSKKGFSASEVRDGFLANICAASDLFSATAVLYMMIFGELYENIENPRRQAPVIGRKVTEKLDNIISRPAQRLLVEILCKGLAHYSSDRYQNAEEMLDAVKKLTVLTEPSVVYPLDFGTHTRSLLPEFCMKRDTMLNAVHDKLEKHNHVFVGGIGGSGKSALSAMFVEKFSSEYDAVQIIGFSSCKDTIKSIAFAGISDNDSYYKENPDDLYTAKLHALQTKTDSRTLIIIENYSKGKDAQFDDLMTCPCRIIFNSRNSFGGNDCLPLEDISEDEAMEYFLNVSERETEAETIKQIIPFTGRNFLLIKLLALKLRNYPNISAEFVLNKLRSNERFDKGRFSFDKFNEETQEEILREVFNISALSSEETEILSAMTLVPYRGIKESNFVTALLLDGEENPIEHLVNLGWITKTGKGVEVKISLHQTISDFFARSKETKPDLDKFAPLLEKMSEVFNFDNAKTLAQREETLADSDFFARRITGNNLACAGIYDLVGCNYCEVYRFSEALEYHNKALKIRLEFLEENSSDVATSYNNIGKAYKGLDNFDKALEYSKKALEIWLPVFGEKHMATATGYDNIGVIYGELDNNYNKALQYFNRAFEIRMSVLGEKHTNTATSYDNIGIVYSKVGDCNKILEYHNKALEYYDTALEYHNKALEIYMSILGEKNPHTAVSYNNIGTVYMKLGDYDESLYDKALKYYNKALEIRLSVLGKRHPDTAAIYNNIGAVYPKLGDFDKALEYHNMALKIRLSVLGEKNTATAESYNNIGSIYSGLNNDARALEYLNKALGIWLPTLGENHTNTRSCMCKIKLLMFQLNVSEISSANRCKTP